MSIIECITIFRKKTFQRGFSIVTCTGSFWIYLKLQGSSDGSYCSDITAYSIDRDAHQIIDQTLDNTSEENVQIGESEDQELDNDVKGRLEDRGYI